MSDRQPSTRAADRPAAGWRVRLAAHLPPFIRRQALLLLLRATAAAFRREMPNVRGLSRELCLRAYARCTAAWSEEALASGQDLSALRARLYQNSYRLGRLPGRLLGARSLADVMALGRSLYGLLDIDFDGGPDGLITIRRCYFSPAYSPQVCQLMSAMDSGLLAGLAGLAGAGDLVFTGRLTEGQPGCRARFTLAACPARLREEHPS